MPPEALDLPDFRASIEIGVSHLNLNSGAVFHRYGDPPGSVAARFTGDIVVTAHVSAPKTVHGTIQAKKGWITSANGFTNVGLPWIYVLPQIAPLQTEEHLKSDVYVADNMFSGLSSRHFRNQLFLLDTKFPDFKHFG